MRSATIALLVASSWIAGAFEQQPATGRGVILGRVVEVGSGAPIRNAQVVLTRRQSDDAPQTVFSDANGQFVFSAVAAGRFMLWATRSGYARASFGQRRPFDGSGEELKLGEDDRVGDITLRLWKHGSISGTVRDESGEPIAGIGVKAFRRTYVAGRPTLGDVTQLAATDDRGIYRLHRLVAGEYVVGIPSSTRSLPSALSARMADVQRSGAREERMALGQMLASAGVSMSPAGTPGSLGVGNAIVDAAGHGAALTSDRLFVYPTRYYPDSGTPSAARAIAIAPGQEVNGIDMSITAIPSFAVSGRLLDDGGGVAGLPIRLLPGAGTDFAREMLSPGSATLSDDEGRFVVMGVTPGEHTLRVLKGRGGEIGGEFVSVRTTDEGGVVIASGALERPTSTRPAMARTRFAATSVTIGEQDVAGLEVAVSNGVRLSGRVEFAGSTTVPDAAALRRLHPVVEARDGIAVGFAFEMTGDIGPDHTFETVELPPGRYFLRMPNTPPGWTLESVMFGGRDISDQPLEVANQPITGIVIRLSDRPSSISGMVSTSTRADRLDEAFVIAFPAGRNDWIDFGNTPRRLASAPVARDGTYRISGLPAGEYLIAALRDDMLVDWRHPTFLEAASPLAVRVSLAAGEQKTQALRMGTVR
jgi:hypothetical protein